MFEKNHFGIRNIKKGAVLLNVVPWWEGRLLGLPVREQTVVCCVWSWKFSKFSGKKGPGMRSSGRVPSGFAYTEYRWKPLSAKTPENVQTEHFCKCIFIPLLHSIYTCTYLLFNFSYFLDHTSPECTNKSGRSFGLPNSQQLPKGYIPLWWQLQLVHRAIQNNANGHKDCPNGEDEAHENCGE